MMDIKSQAAIEQATAEMRETLPHLTTAFRVYRDALVAGGFTKEEALYMVAQHTTVYGFKELKHG